MNLDMFERHMTRNSDANTSSGNSAQIDEATKTLKARRGPKDISRELRGSRGRGDAGFEERGGESSGKRGESSIGKALWSIAAVETFRSHAACEPLSQTSPNMIPEPLALHKHRAPRQSAVANRAEALENRMPGAFPRSHSSPAAERPASMRPEQQGPAPPPLSIARPNAPDDQQQRSQPPDPTSHSVAHQPGQDTTELTQHSGSNISTAGGFPRSLSLLNDSTQHLGSNISTAGGFSRSLGSLNDSVSQTPLPPRTEQALDTQTSSSHAPRSHTKYILENVHSCMAFISVLLLLVLTPSFSVSRSGATITSLGEVQNISSVASIVPYQNITDEAVKIICEDDIKECHLHPDPQNHAFYDDADMRVKRHICPFYTCRGNAQHEEYPHAQVIATFFAAIRDAASFTIKDYHDLQVAVERWVQANAAAVRVLTDIVQEEPSWYDELERTCDVLQPATRRDLWSQVACFQWRYAWSWTTFLFSTRRARLNAAIDAFVRDSMNSTDVVDVLNRQPRTVGAIIDARKTLAVLSAEAREFAEVDARELQALASGFGKGEFVRGILEDELTRVTKLARGLKGSRL